MKILLAYAATGDYMQTLSSTLAIQSQLLAWHSYVPIVVSDIAAPKSLGIQGLKTDAWANGQFNLARCRNVAIDYAAKKGFDWLVLIDADAIVLNAPSILPETGFARLWLRRTRPAEAVSALTAEAAADPPHLMTPEAVRLTPWQRGWYLLGKPLFDRRFCEDLSGYGFEEPDFLGTVLSDLGEESVHNAATDLSALHLWHAPRAWAKERDPAVIMQHRAIYERRRAPVLRALRRVEAEAAARVAAEIDEKIRKSREAEAAARSARAAHEAGVQAAEIAARKLTTKTRNG